MDNLTILATCGIILTIELTFLLLIKLGTLKIRGGLINGK